MTIQNKSELVRIAKGSFPYLSSKDVEFLTAVEEGTLYDGGKPSVTDSASSHEAGKSKSHGFNANLIIWVCTNKKAVSLVTRHGIRLEGATIDGKLDLSYIRVPFPLVFKNCILVKGVNLRNACIGALDMTGTQAAKVDLAGATIEGNLDFTNATLTSAGRGNALDCEGVTINGSVYLNNGFKAKGSVGFVDATINGNLECNNGEFINPDGMALDCERLNARGDVFFCEGQWGNDLPAPVESFKAEGEVKLVNARIGGNLECKGGKFINDKGNALLALGLTVGGNVLLHDGFEAKGSVGFVDATINGNLECNNGWFINPDGDGMALDCERLNAKGDVFFCKGQWGNGPKAPEGSSKAEGEVNFFKAEGEVKLVNARIGGNLECKGGEFINDGGNALLARGLTVHGNIFLNNGFRAKGSVGFVDATINGNLECNNGWFINQDGMALDCERLNAGGDVFFCEGQWNAPKAPEGSSKAEGEVNFFKAEGEVKLVNARIGGNFECKGGGFINEGGNALLARGLTVHGNVFLRNGFRAKGSVGFVDATINGNLECNNGWFINPNGDGMALDCKRLKAGGDVFFNKRIGQRSDDSDNEMKPFEAQGTVSFVCAEIRGYFSWLDVKSPHKVTLDLRYAKVGIYSDDSKSWPVSGKLRLEGFRYDSIEESDPSGISDRVKWLSLQYPEKGNGAESEPSKLSDLVGWFRRQYSKKGKSPFYPQPYEQLADVFKRIGDDKAAKKILIEKNSERSRKANLSFSETFWDRFFGKIIGYGYAPWRSLLYVLSLIAFGCLVFYFANENGLMTPTDTRAIANTNQQISKDYPVFNALVYSIDTFVPLVDLGVSKYYLPNANRKKPVPPSKFFALFVNGSHIRIYLWFHIAAGWILTSLLVAALTGLVRK